MARIKTTSGKGNRTGKTQDNLPNPASIPEVNAAPVTKAAFTEVNEVPAALAVKSATSPETTPESKPETRPEATTTTTKMFEVRKPDIRKNVVPINLEDEIRRRAYELYQQRGPGLSNEADDWLTAEREVMQRYRQHSA
ncbi:MAG TPA: DUF2934 domain-containing protein [Candidatus Polarisedimenticolia bacterium]|nr:DUF2934 domain-containing protein [Candidatus Polarisedimenticolia bacterium]